MASAKSSESGFSLKLYRDREWFSENFKVDGIYFIGEGSNFSIFGAMSKYDNFYKALKIIRIQTDEEYVQLTTAFHTLEKLNDKNIMKVERMFADKEKSLFITVIPLGDNTLQNYLLEQPNCCLPKDICHSIARDLISAVSYSHSNRVVHQDLHPGVIIFFGDVSKITGWGGAITPEHKERPSSYDFFSKQKKFNFNASFACPEWEAAIGENTVGRSFDYYKKDIFALGMIIFNMCGVSRKNIDNIPRKNKEEYDNKIEKLIKKLNLIDNYSLDFIDFLKLLIAYEEKNRPYGSLANSIMKEIIIRQRKDNVFEMKGTWEDIYKKLEKTPRIESTEILDLYIYSDNQDIQKERFTAISTELFKVSKLNKLNLRLNTYSEEQCMFMGKLASNNKLLEQMNIDLSNTEFQDIERFSAAGKEKDVAKKRKSVDLRVRRASQSWDKMMNRFTIIGTKVENIFDLFRNIHFWEKLNSFSLNLSGTKVSDGTAKSLYALKLSKIKFLDLNIENTNISDKGIEHITEILSDIKDLVSLDLKFGNRIKDRGKGLASFNSSILQCRTLRDLSLSFRESDLGDSSLSEMTSNIKILSLESFSLSLRACKEITDLGLKTMSANLSFLSDLTTLKFDFASTSIGDDSAESVSSFLKDMNKISKVSLNFGKTLLTDRGIGFIANALVSKPLESVTLNFGWVFALDDGLISISLLLEKIKELKEISLDYGGNHISKKGMSAFSLAVKKMDFISILHINLEDIIILDKSLFNLLASIELVKNSLTDLTINLWGTSMTDFHVVKISEMVRNLDQLKAFKFIIGGLFVTDDSLMQLAKSLQDLSAHKRLSTFHLKVRSPEVKDKAMQSLSHALSSFKSDLKINLDLMSINLTDEGLEALYHGFSLIDKLIEFHLNICNTNTSFGNRSLFKQRLLKVFPFALIEI